MKNELTLYIDDDLQAKILKVRELAQAVNEKQYEAKVDGKVVDYTNYPEYTELHNLNLSMRQDLANAACMAVGVTI
jgi:hypothetical protein